MQGPLSKHYLSLLTCLLLLAPAQLPAPASGSAILHSPADFKNGTVTNTTVEAGGLLLGRTTVPDDWMLQGCVFSPPTVCSPAFGYDPVRGASYLVGRSRTTTNEPTEEAWTYDAGKDLWARVNMVPMPAAANGTGIYDDNQGQMIVLSANASVTHMFKVANGTWANLNPAASPSARTGYSLAFDNSSRKAYLFGGAAGGTYPNDTWVYDAAANTWTNPTTNGAPPGRENAAMAYDSSNGVVLLFGGSVTNTGQKNLLGDTWAYDPSAKSWSNKTPTTSPPAREYSAMAHYPAPVNETVLFGGVIVDPREYINDTWTYKLAGNIWTNRTSASAPAPRSRHSMAFDAGKGLLIMAGGLGHADYNWRADSWSLDRKTWNWTMGTLQAPSWRTGAEYAQDAGNGTLYIFGGDDGAFVPGAPNTRIYCGDTWRFDGPNATWKLLSPTKACQNLSPRSGLRTSWAKEASGSTMVYDERNKDLILFGPMAGHTDLAEDRTYVFNFSTGEWKDIGTTGIGDAAGGVFSATYNARTGEILLFVGKEKDIYTLNRSQNAWKPFDEPLSTQNDFDDASIVILESTGELFLYGSVAHSPLTATFNFTTPLWSKKANANDPPARIRFSMAYDSFRDEVVLAGGDMSNLPSDETWCFNVTADAWSKLNPGKTFPKMKSPASFYCGPQNEVLMLGGVNAPESFPFLYSFDRRNYCLTGEFNSSINDTGGETYFGRISWTADLPDNTNILARVRSGADPAALQASNYKGKNDNASTYFRNGDQIDSIHNGSRYIQYKLFMGSQSIWSSPLLRSINITYNRKHTVNITSPSNSSNWTGQKTISWQMTGDPDRDNYTSTVELYDATGTTFLDNITSGCTNRSYSWDTRYVPDGTYRIRVNVTDNNTEIPLNNSSMTEKFNISHPNHAPIVELLEPGYGDIINTSSVSLKWNGSDADNDFLNYTVYIGLDDFTEELPPDDPYQTNATSVTIPDLVNNTYYWSVIANDGKDNSTIPEVRRFEVRLPDGEYRNNPPVVTLLLPADGDNVTNTSTSLSWHCKDNDAGDQHTFFVFRTEASFNISNLPKEYATTKDRYLDIGNLTDMTTYYWTVIANDSKENGTVPPPRKFTVVLPVPPETPLMLFYSPNHTRTSLDSIIIFAYDRPMDGLSVAAALSFEPPIKFTGFTSESNVFSFSPISRLAPATNYKVQISKDAMSLQGWPTFRNFTWNFTTIGLGDIDEELPTVLFTSPRDGLKNVDRREEINISFSKTMNKEATRAACSIIPVVNGTWIWLFNSAIQFIPAHPLANGSYRVTIASSAKDLSGNLLDGNKNRRADGAADNFVFNFTVGIREDGNPILKDWSPKGAGVSTGARLVLYFDRSMDPGSVSTALHWSPDVKGCWTYDAEWRTFTFSPSKKLRPGTPYSITLASTTIDIHGNRLDKEYQFSFKTVPLDDDGWLPPTWLIPAIVATIIAAGVAVALSRRGRAAARGAAAAAPRGFAVDDIFLMYNDGRLIQHTTRRLKADMDVDIFTSMLAALQGFVKESVGRESGGELGSMEYGGNKVLLEKGKYVVVAVVITGGEPAGFRDDMRAAVRNIEGELGAVLAGWDGSTARLAKAQKFLELLGSYRAAEEPAAAAAAKIDVSVRSELEFYQGFVRLKVAVKNQMETMIARAELKLVFNEGVLRLDRIEPAVESRGGEVVLGIIEPGEKKTVAFFLDPQICTESHIEGVLTFKDARGNLETVKMPRKLASVVCPVLFTDENINTAMLKRMAAEELDKKDSKVFTIPSTMTAEKAFEVGKAAVQHHDLRLVRELKEDKPFRAEAWYFGKAKGRPDRLVVRVRVIPEMTFLEFSVSSDSILMLTGMLAELKSDLNKELEAHHLKGAMKQVTDRDDMEAVAEIRLLLEKAKEPDGG